MSDPYIGEIRMFGGNFAPAGWAFCDGQLMAIAENDVLFNLIGTTYGGDGQSTFALPDLRSRVPLHQGVGFTIAQNGGTESVTVTTSQTASHTHPMMATNNNAAATGAAGNVLAQTPTYSPYLSGFGVDSTLASTSIGTVGGSQPHENRQPFQAVNFIISLFGIFPSPT
jgi:microcystin-dependent protein